jgi:dihydrofolate synthase/folylpolyglutamate synthase
MTHPPVAAGHAGAGASDAAYHAVLGELAARGRFGINLGLGRVRALLAALGDPQLGIRGVLVGGTNGKGSVLALAGSAVRAAGLRAGETPKPHLVTYRERLQVAGRPIEPAAFAALLREVMARADRLDPGLGPPTEFELLTAAMFRWFASEAVDLALVEVGLGGRLDATNAWDGGVAAITNVDLDHTDRLGTTVEAIAVEKAAIIEAGDRAVTAATGPALDVIRARAADVGAPLRVVEPAPLVGWDRDGIDVVLPGLGPTRVGLRGRHQAANVALADALLDELEAAGIARVDAAARRTGYAAARWPGRLELLEVPAPSGGLVEVLLDGAHNPAAAGVLATALDDLRPHLAGGGEPPSARPRLTLVTAVMADKDVEGIVAALAGAEALAGARVIATEVPGGRSIPAADLARSWATGGGRGLTVGAEPDPRRAVDDAIAGAPGTVVVTGSLYLVGAVRARLVDDPLLRDPAAPTDR